MVVLRKVTFYQNISCLIPVSLLREKQKVSPVEGADVVSCPERYVGLVLLSRLEGSFLAGEKRRSQTRSVRANSLSVIAFPGHQPRVPTGAGRVSQTSSLLLE